MAIKELKINRFEGGLTENLRDTSGNKVWYTENVLLEKSLVSQTVNVSAVNSQGYSSGYGILKLIEVSGTIWGIGRVSGANDDISLYKKTVGSSNNWALATNGTITGTSLALYDPFFVYYGGDIYMQGDGNYIAKYSGTTMSGTYVGTSGAMKGGVVWQGDMYGYVGQTIYKITTSPSVTSMIDIPTGQTIIQMIPYGNYLAIVCSGTGIASKMYLWDGITTTTFSDIIEIGNGDVSGGELYDGTIYAVISKSNNMGLRLMGLSGGRFVQVYDYRGRYNQARTKNYAFGISRLKTYGNHLYFIVGGTRSDSTFTDAYEAQVFRYGRVNPDEPNSLSCWKTLFSDGTSSNTIGKNGNDFIVYESAVTQPQPQMLSAVLYGLAGANSSYYYEMTTTYNSTEDTTSSASAVIETPTFNCGESNAIKNLKGVALSYDPLPTAGSVVLKYRKDEETTWTTIFTDTTDSAVSHSTVVIESSGANLPTFKEIQFRIELSGNAKLTAYKFKYEAQEEITY